MKGRYCTNVYYQCRYTTKPILSLFDNPKMKTLIDSNFFCSLRITKGMYNMQMDLNPGLTSSLRFQSYRLFCGKLFPKPSNKFCM